MSVNPYNMLGISPDATPDAIRKAYRARAKKAHPDHGGDAAEFRAIQLAYEIASDPARREHFDRTGETDEPPPPITPEAQFAVTVQPFLLAVLFNLTKENTPVGSVDLIAMLTLALQKHETGIRGKLKTFEKMRDSLRESASRIETDGAENLLATMAKSQMRTIDEDKQIAEKELGRIGDAIAMLKNYKYRKSESLFNPYGTYDEHLKRLMASFVIPRVS